MGSADCKREHVSPGYQRRRNGPEAVKPRAVSTLTTRDFAAIRGIFRQELRATLTEIAVRAGTNTVSYLPHRLTVPEFAFCLEVEEETARCWLRDNKCGIVSRKLAVRQGKWKISPEALPLLGVTQEMALARLQARALRESAPQAPHPG